MKILLCPDKFKGSLSAQEVCETLRMGLLSVHAQLEILDHPMADGGDGSIDILQNFLPLTPRDVETIDPIGRNIKARYYHSDDTAFIELASASGIVLLDQKERNPLLTSTQGTGIMIKDAIDREFQKIQLFIGGSATNDGGLGIAHALGFRFLDESGNALEPIGMNLSKVHRIENRSSQDLDHVEITVLCDVTNPMYGPNGAAYVYGPQKGAAPDEVSFLDEGLKNLAAVIQRDLDIDLSMTPGIGAAGAVSAALVALFNAQLENGFQMLSRITALEDALKNADLVLTGEGKIDPSSFQGKVVGNVISMCQQHSISCGIIGGMIEDMNENHTNFAFQKSILSMAKDIQDAMTAPKPYLFQIGVEIGNSIKDQHSST